MSSETMSKETLDADVAICGAGPVGMALAALLARRGVPGHRIVLIDGKSLGQAISDPRSIALSWGSRLLLEDLGAWSVIGGSGTPIHQIHVSRRGHLGRSRMDRAEHDLEALGYVARYGDVADALARACERAGVQGFLDHCLIRHSPFPTKASISSTVFGALEVRIR